MKEIIVILDNIRSALNVGAIMRTCDGAGVKKIYLAGITPYPPHPRVLKTALGAEESLDFEHIQKKETIKIIENYKSKGFEVYSIEETENTENFFEKEFGDKLIFVMGNEITGVNEEIMNVSNATLKLPMLGKKNSLNVATTTGIVIYNAQFAK